MTGVQTCALPICSHLLADVEDVCHRVVIYYGGKIQAAGTLKDLLAQPDTMRITTPLLPRATIERVLETIRQDAAEDRVRIDTPTQNLESYFLGVVQKAKQSEAETSGATSGHRVAAYLRGDADAPASQPDKILERLSLPAAERSTTPAPDAQPAEAIDEKRLGQLAKPQEAPLTPAAPAESTAKAAELAKANVKLSSLLGKPK